MISGKTNCTSGEGTKADRTKRSGVTYDGNFLSGSCNPSHDTTEGIEREIEQLESCRTLRACGSKCIANTKRSSKRGGSRVHCGISLTSSKRLSSCSNGR